MGAQYTQLVFRLEQNEAVRTVRKDRATPSPSRL